MSRFPKNARMLRAQEYTDVLRGPQINLSAGPLRIRARKNRMCAARLGLIIPKKGNRLAVRRNRIKRLIREQFRQYQAQLPDYDVVVQVFAPIEDEVLCARLQDMWQQLVAADRATNSGT